MIFAHAPYAAKTVVPKLVIKVVKSTNHKALTDISSDEGNQSCIAFLINQRLGLKSEKLSLMPKVHLKSNATPITAEIHCVINVANAAPCGPIEGIGPNPKMNIGSIMKLSTAVPAMM